MSKLVKYYFDLMSQPSRALWIALKMGNIPFEECPVALRKSTSFRQVDGDFHLSESVAMIRYLADKGLFSPDLYPKDLQNRARVDEFLEWQHLTLRAGCSMYFMRCWLLPMNGLAHMPSQERIDRLIKEMENNLKLVEKIWLKDADYVSGKKLTVADLMGACEIEQTKLCKYDVSKKFPKVTDWLARVREETNPHYDEAHKYIYKKSGL
ncbi:Glutathione S-transferase theta-1 [Lucilia cuprina]|nr:Glutathione S-transferase theta-1 [Lucilia cuprina]